jgi:hypothetical protein
MKLCKPFYSRHKWTPYGELVPQLGVGTNYSWYKCEKCKARKFDFFDDDKAMQDWLNGLSKKYPRDKK